MEQDIFKNGDVPAGTPPFFYLIFRAAASGAIVAKFHKNSRCAVSVLA